MQRFSKVAAALIDRPGIDPELREHLDGRLAASFYWPSAAGLLGPSQFSAGLTS